MSNNVSSINQSDKEKLFRFLAEFIDDPYGFVMCCFRWGEGELSGEEGPDEWQAEVLKYIGKATDTFINEHRNK